MRILLIDSIARTITVQDMAEGLDAMYAMLGCSHVDVIKLGGTTDMWMDGEGLLNIERGPYEKHPEGCACFTCIERMVDMMEDNYQGQVLNGFFVLVDSDGIAHNLVVGKAFVAAHNGEGDTVGIDDHFTPEQMAKFIRFVPDHNRNKAAIIAEALLDNGGMATTQAELEHFQLRQANLMQDALELATINPLEPCPS
jgi:hypothetical protein